MGPDVKGNPLYISVYLLIASYIIGEFIFPKYPLLYILNLFGLLIIILILDNCVFTISTVLSVEQSSIRIISSGKID